MRLQEDSKEFKAYKEVAGTGTPAHFKKTFEEQETKTKEALSLAAAKNDSHEHTLPHPIWSEQEVDSVKITHKEPKIFSDKLAFWSVMTMRTSFDLLSGYTIGYKFKTLDERSVLNRCIFLETVAGKSRLRLIKANSTFFEVAF